MTVRYTSRSNITKKKIRFFFRNRFGQISQPYSPISKIFRVGSFLKIVRIHKFIMLNRQFMKQMHGITRDIDLRHFHKYAFKKASKKQSVYLFMSALERRITSVLYQARLIYKVKHLRLLIKKKKISVNETIQRSLMHRINPLDIVHYTSDSENFSFLDRPYLRMIIWKLKMLFRYYRKFMYIYLKKIYLRFEFSSLILSKRYLYHILSFSSAVYSEGSKKEILGGAISSNLQNKEFFSFPHLFLYLQKFVISFFFYNYQFCNLFSFIDFREHVNLIKNFSQQLEVILYLRYLKKLSLTKKESQTFSGYFLPVYSKQSSLSRLLNLLDFYKLSMINKQKILENANI